jgi:hypothetical protein
MTSTVFLPLTGIQGAVYLPVVKGSGVELSAVQKEQVYGLMGWVEATPNRSYDQQLRLANGKSYALLGVNADMEAALNSYAASPPDTIVKVWGTLYRPVETDQVPYVVITDVVVERQLRATPIITPTVTPTFMPPSAMGRFDLVNLRSGPDSRQPRTGAILLGEVCAISGRTDTGAWILIDCPAGARGWIEARLVTIAGDVAAAPVVQPQATPTPTLPPPTPLPPTPIPTPPAVASQGWTALYFANLQMAGVPVAVGNIPVIDFNWGAGAPVAGLPVDGFSIVFERVFDFAPGFYFVTVEADDGVRIFVDGQLIMDQWNGPAGQVYRIGRLFDGQSDLRVEYNEAGGAARIRVVIQPAPPPMRWDAAYFLTPGGVNGVTRTQSEPDGGSYRLDYNWGAGGSFGAPADNWSARWVGRYRFEAGNYTFYVQGEDGIRLSINGLTVIDKWSDGYGALSNRFVGVGGEEHTITVEYFDRSGPASLRVWWVKDTGAAIPQ